MPSRSVELEPAEEISVVTVGEPGTRQFFLVARGGTRTVSFACEKFHIEGLVARTRELLEAQGVEEATDAPAGGDQSQATEPEWAIAELGLGYHEARDQFVIVAREQAGDESGEPATARLWAARDAMQRFVRQATSVLAGGRPTCPRCGLAMDPTGHPCPALNGSRPVF